PPPPPSHALRNHSSSLFFLSVPLPPPRSTLFPYTTLFRSVRNVRAVQAFNHEPVAQARFERQNLAAARASIFALDLEARYSPLADRKSTRLNSSHVAISYAVFCLKKKKEKKTNKHMTNTHR